MRAQSARRCRSATFEGEVEAAKAIASQRVGAALQHNGAGLVHVHDLLNDLRGARHRYHTPGEHRGEPTG